MKQYHKNPRQITEPQFKDLGKSLDKLGDLGGIVHDLNSDEIIGGNQRSRVFDVNACQVEMTLTYDKPDEQGTVGQGFVVWNDHRYAYRQVRWTPAQCEEANIKANKAGGDWNWDTLANEWSAADLQGWGFDAQTVKQWSNNINGLKELLKSEQAGGADAEPQTDRAAELLEKWQVKTGDLWQIGDHRLICGDCTDAATVARVMDEERADMVFTSPPYNQGNEWGELLTGKKGNHKMYPKSENDDDMTDDEYMDFMFSVLNTCAEIVNDIHSVVWNVAYNAKSRNLYGKIIFSDRNPFQVFKSIVWNKGGAINLPHVGIYSRWCEFVYVMTKGEKYLTSQEYGNPRWNYWETKKVNQLEEHKATFPLEFAERGVSELSIPGSVVFEPFCGSGTVLVACENLRRIGRACELSPAYVAVALERMSTAFPSLPIRRLDAGG
jgi:DNA modification methylase